MKKLQTANSQSSLKSVGIGGRCARRRVSEANRAARPGAWAGDCTGDADTATRYSKRGNASLRHRRRRALPLLKRRHAASHSV